jgi:hypothetical protein
MARSRRLLCGLLGLLLAAGLAVLTISRPLDHRPVYSVAALRSQLAEDPEGLVGRTLLVRGVAVTGDCAFIPEEVGCGVPQLSLRDPDPATARYGLDLALGPVSPLPAFMRHMPLVGAFLPAPQAIHWGVVATYRARILAPSDTRCGSACAVVVLLDAAP